MQEKTKSVFNYGEQTADVVLEGLVDDLVSEKIKEGFHLIPKEQFIKQDGNLIDLPTGRYDHKLSTSAQYKDKNYITYVKGDAVYKIGSMFGALEGKEDLIFNVGIVGLTKVKDNYSYVAFFDRDMLDFLKFPKTKFYYKLLRRTLQKAGALHLTYNKFIKIDEAKKKERVTIDIPIFYTAIYYDKLRLWIAVWHPVFHKNFYYKFLSVPILLELTDPRSNRAYRYLDKAMGKKNCHKEDISSLMTKLSIVRANATERLKQLKKSLNDVKRAYNNVGWTFTYKFKDNIFYCEKLKQLDYKDKGFQSLYDKQDEAPQKSLSRRDIILTKIKFQIVVSSSMGEKSIPIEAIIKKLEGVKTDKLEDIYELCCKNKWQTKKFLDDIERVKK